MIHWCLTGSCSDQMPETEDTSESYDNYTIKFNRSLHLDGLYEPTANFQQLIWTHNGHTIDTMNSNRISIAANGGLTLNEVQPSDAGYYTLTISNGSRCESMHFKVAVECNKALATSQL